MLIPFLFAIFETFLFPRGILSENQFNPATLHQNQFEITIDTEVKFGLTELRIHRIHSQIRTYSISVASFGNDIYRENIVGLGLSFPVVEKLAAGFNISAINYWIKDNCSCFGYSLRIGAIFWNNPIELGAWINNINMPKFSEVDYVPLSYSFRGRFLAMENLSFYFATRGLDTDLPFFNFGLFYAPYKIIEFGMGINTDPILLEYGLKIFVGQFDLYYSGSNHRQLGLSHQLGVGFCL